MRAILPGAVDAICGYPTALPVVDFRGGFLDRF
jgi:hypothetical protein